MQAAALGQINLASEFILKKVLHAKHEFHWRPKMTIKTMTIVTSNPEHARFIALNLQSLRSTEQTGTSRVLRAPIK